MLKTTVVGNYPKISSDRSAPNLRNALNQAESGKITPQQVEEVYQSTIRRVIEEQKRAGVDLITDGQIRWNDIVTPFAKKISGFEINGLLRFFDNNVYYRKPVLKAKPAFNGSAAVEQFRFAQKFAGENLKAVIPGPFTFARMSVDEFFGNEEKFVLTLAELLHQEAVALVEAGATWVQIDEPCLCVEPGKIDLVRRGIEIVTRGLKAKTMLFLYFGSIKPLVPKLFEFPVDAFGVDCVSRPENFSLLLTAPKGKGICCGCLDGRNIKLETDRELFPYFEKLAARTDGGEVFISPSSGLEFLPHADAVQKLERMVTAVRTFNTR